MTYSLFRTTFTEEVYDFPAPLTVVLDKPWSEQPEANREALTKLLAAVGHQPASVRMVHQQKLDLSAWSDMPSKLVAFVSPPPGIALNEKIVTPTTEMVVTEPLGILLTDEGVKRKFWAAFKTLFPS
jgi:hypothetical protein